MPSIFFGHGNPMNALEDNAYTRAWKTLGATLPRPQAILVVSAHWYLPGCRVTTMAAPRTIHDFGGFPRQLFEVQYPAPGHPGLAQTPEHYLPLLYVIGASREGEAVRFPVEGLDGGSVSMLAVQIG